MMLAVEAPTDDVLSRFVGVRLGVGKLLEEGSGDPPVAARVMDRRSEEAGGVGPFRGGEAAAVVAPVVPVLGAGVPARRELIGKAARELDLALTLPFAVKALAFGRSGEIRCPDEAILEEILLQDELAFELALVESPAWLDIERKADDILVGA